MFFKRISTLLSSTWLFVIYFLESTTKLHKYIRYKFGFRKLCVINWRWWLHESVYLLQLNWYFSVSALIYDLTMKKMTPPVIHICHKQIALLSGWHFFLRGLFVAIMGEIHSNKLFFGCNTIYLFFFADFLARGLGVKVKGRVEKQDCNEQWVQKGDASRGLTEQRQVRGGQE